MNQDQVKSILRNVLLFAGGVLVAKGKLSADDLTQIVGGIIALVSVVMSQLHHADAPRPCRECERRLPHAGELRSAQLEGDVPAVPPDL